MEKIEPGKYVEMVYDLSVVTPDGEELVHKVEPDSPERIVFGVTKGRNRSPEKAIEGLKKGDAFDVKVGRGRRLRPSTTPSRWLISTSRFSKSRKI